MGQLTQRGGTPRPDEVRTCVIRPSTDDERKKLKRKWVKSFIGHGSRTTRLSGERGVATATLERAIRHEVDRLMDTAIVASVVDPLRPARAIGYVAYSLRQDGRVALHYVFVETSARRRGLAKSAVETVLDGRDYVTTFMTPDGSNLIGSLGVSDAAA